MKNFTLRLGYHNKGIDSECTSFSLREEAREEQILLFFLKCDGQAAKECNKYAMQLTRRHRDGLDKTECKYKLLSLTFSFVLSSSEGRLIHTPYSSLEMPDLAWPGLGLHCKSKLQGYPF